MEHLLTCFSAPNADPTELFSRLIEVLRPQNADDFEFAQQQLNTLCTTLDSRPDLREAVRNQLSALSERKRHSELYTSAGILPNTGFFSEIFRRLGHKTLVIKFYPRPRRACFCARRCEKRFTNPAMQNGSLAWGKTPG